MSVVKNILGSSLGKKFIMAVSGCVLFLFVIAHLAGNLQVFLGPEALNRYGHFLQSNPELIWPARLFLLLMVGLHIWSATKLSLENTAARPVGYAEYHPVASSLASRTMMMSGSIIFIFIIYHLLHFTAQVKYINLTGQNFVDFTDPQKRHDIFKMMVVGFNNLWVSGFYILGMALLCLHLSHGASSLLFLGYTSIPVAILLGYGKEALK